MCGSRAAQSWEGWAAAWITSSSPETSAKARSTASESRMSASIERNSGWASVSESVTCWVEASGPKKRERMSFSMPTTS